ncbi:response regulator [Kibdelosporangium phytohabitans]|uniref:LuxR family transcriptional regulator n=1 Tax=Kibdelosporangium phytohabitans TaxID=860235 RepID=A0A0N9I876_9PSEU|nr:response regulator transcription factor [Kibdelosporangium phytohabitans]ALG11128.1 LuxR family transcriptional regulator [Kibdelosporangium phytohabitans]MBE1462376.1 DNA-binding NarL/FixJ family response regulator [Kibdelosporangium phytohabitans]
MGIKVGIVEDHPLYRSAVAQLITQVPDFELDAVAESVAQFVVRRTHRDSVVALDLNLPGVQGAAAVMDVVALGHPVLVISAHAGQQDVLSAMAAGARGFLSKDTDGDELLRALRLIAMGDSYISPTLASYVLDATRGGHVIELSSREREVLSLVASGERDQDIADELAISIRTVRSYLDRIRDKTGQRCRSELTRYAIEQGVLARRTA